MLEIEIPGIEKSIDLCMSPSASQGRHGALYFKFACHRHCIFNVVVLRLVLNIKLLHEAAIQTVRPHPHVIVQTWVNFSLCGSPFHSKQEERTKRTRETMEGALEVAVGLQVKTMRKKGS